MYPEKQVPQPHHLFALADLDLSLHVAALTVVWKVVSTCRLRGAHHLLTCVCLHTWVHLLQVVNVFADDFHVLQAVLGILSPTECQYGRATRKPPDMHLQPRQTGRSACLLALLVGTAVLVMSALC